MAGERANTAIAKKRSRVKAASWCCQSATGRVPPAACAEPGTPWGAPQAPMARKASTVLALPCPQPSNLVARSKSRAKEPSVQGAGNRTEKRRAHGQLGSRRQDFTWSSQQPEHGDWRRRRRHQPAPPSCGSSLCLPALPQVI